MGEIKTPVYELIVPSTGMTVFARPYSVGEEKVLAMAGESEDQSSIITAVKRLVQACTDLDVDALTMFDLEYMFIHIRAKAVGEVSKIKVMCSDESCGTYNDVSLDLSKTSLVKAASPDAANTIQLSPDVELELGYITVGAFNRFQVGKNYDPTTLETLTKMIACTIVSINSIKSTEYTIADILTFVESFSRDHIDMIRKFIDTIPSVQTTIEFKCRKCKKPTKIVVTGIAAFFKVAMAHMSLINYYKENFSMMQYHGYSLTELEAMLPWEREIYVALLSEHIIKENKRIEEENARAKSASRGR